MQPAFSLRFTKKTWALVAVGLLLLGLSGAAAVVWKLTQSHTGAQADRDNASDVAATPNQTPPPVSATTQTDPFIMASSALLTCVVPPAPTDVPDGATATIEQMRAARASVTAYDAAISAYDDCVDSIVDDGTRQHAGVAIPLPEQQILKTLGTRLHNAALGKDQALANRMNEQIRIFKARHSS